MSTFKYWLTLSCLMVLLLSCSHGGRKVVAVSQCSMDEWRDQMNEEMRREAFFHPELDVEYHSTADNSEEQIRDIESFIQRGVDLIIVAPNEEDALRPVIEKAYDAGIPVVLIDRRAHTDKYTAYVGGDNEEVGRQVAQYIVSKLPHGGNVVEIEGLTSSSSSQERKSGFRSVISQHPEIHIVQDVAADWQRQKAVSAFSQLAAQGWTWNNVDVVFAYNDRMAIGAYEAWRASAGADDSASSRTHAPIFIGVDALMNDTIGVGRIEDGTLEASFLYPTGGDKAMHIAACILNGQPYEREQIMQTSVVNRANVHLMRLQAAHIGEQDQKIELLNSKLDDIFRLYSRQQAMLFALLVLIVVVGALLAFSVRAYRTKQRLNVALEHQKDVLLTQRNELAEQKELVERQRDMLEEERDRLMEMTEPAPQPAAVVAEKERGTDAFLLKLQQVIDQKLGNPDLTVDMLGAEVGLGRVQLYRRCKAVSGMSPNELLRTSRLQRAYRMLQEGDRTVSEVAYAVGFSSPSYFAKCYKDLFGHSPSGE